MNFLINQHEKGLRSGHPVQSIGPGRRPGGSGGRVLRFNAVPFPLFLRQWESRVLQRENVQCRRACLLLPWTRRHVLRLGEVCETGENADAIESDVLSHRWPNWRRIFDQQQIYKKKEIVSCYLTGPCTLCEFDITDVNTPSSVLEEPVLIFNRNQGQRSK